MGARVYIHLKTDINLERSTGCTASVQLSLCIQWLWWDCWLCEDCFIKSFMNSYSGKPEASPLPEWAKTRLCWKWCRALVQGRRVSWLPPFSWKENPQAAASFQHTQLLLLQSVTSLVNHPLFISKSYVKLYTIAFSPSMGKRRDRAFERTGKTKAEKPLKLLAWEIVTCSYI